MTISAEIRNLIYDHISNQVDSYSIRRSPAWSTGTITLSDSASHRRLAVICVNRQICQEFLSFLFGSEEEQPDGPPGVRSARKLSSKNDCCSWRSFTIRTDVSVELTNPWEIWQIKSNHSIPENPNRLLQSSMRGSSRNIPKTMIIQSRCSSSSSTLATTTPSPYPTHFRDSNSLRSPLIKSRRF